MEDAQTKKKKRRRRKSASLLEKLDAEYGKGSGKTSSSPGTGSGKKRDRTDDRGGSTPKSKALKVDEVPLVTNFLQSALQFGCNIPEHKAKAIIASKVTGKVILLDNPQRDKDRSVQDKQKRARRRKSKDKKRMGSRKKREIGLFSIGSARPDRQSDDTPMDNNTENEQTVGLSKPQNKDTRLDQEQNLSGEKQKKKKKKKKKARKKREKVVVEYKKHLPLLRMWQSYMSDMICKEAKKGEHGGSEQQVLINKHRTQRWQSEVLLNADYHGCELEVVQSQCPSYVGIQGIVLQETENTFKIVTKQDELKILPKAHSMFAFTLHGKTFALEGDIFMKIRSRQQGGE